MGQPKGSAMENDRLSSRRRPPSVSIFSRTRTVMTIFAAATLLRLCAVVLSPSLVFLWPSAMHSLFVRPSLSLEQVREADAVRKLASPLMPSLRHAYRLSSTIRIPPLVLAWFSALENCRGEGLLSKVFLILVDLLIAFLLEQIGSFLISGDGNILNDMEEALQWKMPKSILPPNRDLIAIYRKDDDLIRGYHENNVEMCKEAMQSTTKKTTAKEKAYETKEDLTRPIISMGLLPSMASLGYYASPVTILSSNVYGSFQNLPLVFVLLALFEACRRGGSRSISSFCIAAAAYMEYHCVVFLVPCMLIFAQKYDSAVAGESVNDDAENKTTKPNSFRSVFYAAAQPRFDVWPVPFFLVWSGCLQLLSYTLVGPKFYARSILPLVYIPWSGLQPSLSVMWYLHMQLFDRFRDFIGVLILGLPYLLVLPITMRLHRYPSVMIAIFWFIWTIFRPAQTLFDANVGFCLLLWSPRSLARMGILSVISIASLTVPVCLYIVDMWMWLETGNGNANFIYFQCLAYNAFLGIVLAQFCSASVQRDKALRLMAKE